MCKGLQDELFNKVVDGNCFKVCTPTHKSALIANATTIFNLFNINPVDYTCIKTTVEKLKSDDIKWIFIDEVSMISSKICSVIRDIKIFMALSLYCSVIFINYPAWKLNIKMW